MYEGVAELLYQEVTCKRGMYAMSRNTPRRAMYCDAVIRVDARSRRVHTSARVRLGLESRPGGFVDSKDDSDSGSDDSETDNDGWDRPIYPSGMRARSKIFHPEYDPEDFNVVVPYLRRQFPNLRSVRFGCDYQLFGDDSWTLTLHAQPQDVPSTDPTTPSTPKIGHIDYIGTRKYDISDDPSDAMYDINPPSDQYTLSERFDLSVVSFFERSDYDPLHDEWLDVIRDPNFGRLASAVDFGELRIDLEDITELMERQVGSGSNDRLRFVSGQEMVGWNLEIFQSFAEVASRSLETLLLVADWGSDEDPGVSFSDLPSLISIIRTSLPSLSRLRLMITGSETAEAVCGLALTPDALSGGGTLKSLVIKTETTKTSLFNVVRCVAPLLTAEADFHIDIGGRSKNRHWTEEQQIKYHRYLRKQSLQRRYHLSTIDFATLNVSYPRDVYMLKYASNGKPKPLPDTQQRRNERAGEVYADGVLEQVDAGTITQEDGLMKVMKFMANGCKEKG